jgi:hypothetical protein
MVFKLLILKNSERLPEREGFSQRHFGCLPVIPKSQHRQPKRDAAAVANVKNGPVATSDEFVASLIRSWTRTRRQRGPAVDNQHNRT